jgi:parvulin-like peptidyl-prolyl isomerase
LHRGKLALAALAALALALPLAAAAQTRTRRAPARRPAASATSAARRNATPAAPSVDIAVGLVNLSAADMTLLVEGLSFSPEELSGLASSAEKRRSFAKDIARMLGVAAEARANGYAARPELKLQTELARAFVIAQQYFRRQRDAGVEVPEQIVSAAEVDAFLHDPATAPQFEAFLADYATSGPGRDAPLSPEQRSELGRQYGRVMVGMRKGVALGLDRDRRTQLLFMMQQARLLAGAYSKDAAQRFTVTDAETDAYVAKHPELDTRGARAKAEEILRRARAGEDFGLLAGQFSEDPGSRTRGGDLGWFGRGVMVKPFEDAAFALKPGELSGVVESPFGYHIIKLEERRAAQGGAGDEVHARHILVGYPEAAAGDAGSRRMSPRERARAAAEQEKRERAYDEMAARHNIKVAEDYDVGLPRAIGHGVPISPQTPLTRVEDVEPPPPPKPLPTPKPAPTPKETPPARP